MCLKNGSSHGQNLALTVVAIVPDSLDSGRYISCNSISHFLHQHKATIWLSFIVPDSVDSGRYISLKSIWHAHRGASPQGQPECLGVGVWGLGSKVKGVQGYLALKKTPIPLGPP